MAAHPELSQLQARIDQLVKQNFDLELKLRVVHGQLPRVMNASEQELQEQVMNLGQELTDVKAERRRLQSDLQEANKLTERLTAEQSSLRRRYEAKMEDLKDQLDTINKENKENYRLYIEQKEHAMMLKADLDRLITNGHGRPSSMDMSTVTSEGNMSLMSERDKEIMRLSSQAYQLKIDAEKKSRELKARVEKLEKELEHEQTRVASRDEMIRQLVEKNGVVEKKARETEQMLIQERTMQRTYLDQARNHTEREDDSEHDDALGLQSRIEKIAESHLKMGDYSISDSVAALYNSQTDLPNVSARPEDSIMSTTANNMSLSIAFNQLSITGRGDIDSLVSIADALFQRLKLTAGALRAVLGHKNKVVVDLEASIRELEASIQTSFVEGVTSVKKDIDRLQALLSDKEAELKEVKEEKEDLSEELEELKAKTEELLNEERDRYDQRLEELNIVVERLESEKQELTEQYESTIAKLKDDLRTTELQSQENYRLYTEEKERQVIAAPLVQAESENAPIDEEPSAAPSDTQPAHSARWNISECIQRLEKADASSNNIVQLLKTVGTLPVPPQTMAAMINDARQTREHTYKCARFLRSFHKANQSDTVMSDKVREALEKELKSINNVLKSTAVNVKRFNTQK